MVSNKLIFEDSTISYRFLCLFVADPATFLDWNSVPGTLFSSGLACLFSGKYEYFRVCMIASLIL